MQHAVENRIHEHLLYLFLMFTGHFGRHFIKDFAGYDLLFRAYLLVKNMVDFDTVDPFLKHRFVHGFRIRVHVQ